ncbi:hypothetical protein [Massilia aquatica]|uniref:Uncharacterized protein n=1 Tax=Massilia aquatica TaxID=2609000 RepID=A0ABX0MHD9_9BURK|nr:hypothetical protein [Massilia aquatica]NHZ44302.1 hypothetical protein [Massilia aquatica]
MGRKPKAPSGSAHPSLVADKQPGSARSRVVTLGPETSFWPEHARLIVRWSFPAWDRSVNFLGQAERVDYVSASGKAPIGPTTPPLPYELSKFKAEEHAGSDATRSPSMEILDTLAMEARMLNMRFGAMNLALHELEDAVYTGDFAREHATKLSESFKPTFPSWPKNKKTAPYDL